MGLSIDGLASPLLLLLPATAAAALLLHRQAEPASAAAAGGLPPWAVLACVAAAWLACCSRALSRRALNPAPAVPCRGRWPDEVVVVTGGSGGIGRELVGRLEALGAAVAVLDAVPPPFSLGKRSHFFETDVACARSIAAARDGIVARFGAAPSVLVANAGVLRGGGCTLLEAAEADLRATFDVNLLGALHCVRAFVPAMVAADRGHVVVTSSVAAFSPAAGVAAYAASKAALTCAAEGLQTELKHRHGNPRVKVSAVFPAAVKTPMFAQLDLPLPAAVMPVLEPAEVAERMVRILDGGESEMVMMPAMAAASTWLPAMPHWVRVAAQDAGARGTARLAAAAAAAGRRKVC